MKLLILAALLAVIQALSPSPRKDGNAYSNAGQGIHQNTRNEKAPTAQSPSAINMTASQGDQAYSRAKAASDEPQQPIKISEVPPITVRTGEAEVVYEIIYLTFCGLLVAVGGLQVWLLRRTLQAIQTQATHMERQADLMKQTLITTFRPKLIVRKVFLRAGTRIPFAGVPDRPWPVEFTIANIGGSPATVVGWSLAVTAFDNGLPIRLPYQENFSQSFRLAPGEERDDSVEIEDALVPYFRMFGVGPNLSHQKIGRVYFWGRIRYSDDVGVIRNTALCRHYQTETGKFTPLKDSDYEYTD